MNFSRSGEVVVVRPERVFREVQTVHLGEARHAATSVGRARVPGGATGEVVFRGALPLL